MNRLNAIAALCAVVYAILPAAAAESDSQVTRAAVGTVGPVGCLQRPRKLPRLNITKSGAYENYLVDGQWAAGTLVKIKADGVTLRHCEIRNGRHNAVSVYARDVVIDSCKIHHLLKGTFAKQDDAHGITGRPTNLTIRNCEIYLVSGDAVQFDPDRGPWDHVTIENCTFWTAPLEADAAGFHRRERPGENAVDTKQSAANPRSGMTIRNCLFHGWGDGQIVNQAALNLKDHVRVSVSNCVFRDCDIAFRLRGDTGGGRGGSRVEIDRCAVYDTKIAVRMEDAIRDLKITRLGIGRGVARQYQGQRDVGPGYENTGQFTPPAYDEMIRQGVR